MNKPVLAGTKPGRVGNLFVPEGSGRDVDADEKRNGDLNSVRRDQLNRMAQNL